MSDPTSYPDGRSLRRERNRDSVVDSLIELFARGGALPTVEEVANHAGLSPRSLYRYFEDRGALLRAGLAEILERATPLIEFAALGRGNFEERIDTFVDHRLALYQRFGPVVLTAARGAANDPTASEMFAAAAGQLRHQFSEHFEPELGHLDPEERRQSETRALLPFQFRSVLFLEGALENQTHSVREFLVDELMLSLDRFRPATVD